jgi:hypothetical protein
MESNDGCVCIDYRIRQLEKLISSLVNSYQSLNMNTNSPSTDSGYITNPSNNIMNGGSSNGSSISLNSLWNFGLVIMALLLLASFLRQPKSKSTKKE